MRLAWIMTGLTIWLAAMAVGCGPDGDPYEPDDSLEDAPEITVGESQTRTFHSDSDVDHAWFAAKEHTAYVIYTELTSSDMDSILTLLDASGDVLAENDDYETQDYFGLESRISWTSETGGTVFVEIESWSDAEPGTYYLTLELNDLYDTYEPDGSAEMAAEIADGETQERSFHDIDDVDYARFEAAKNGLYDISTTIPEGEPTDPYISILDAEGRQLAFNDDENAYTAAARLTWFALEAGTYYIAVGCRYPGDYALSFADESEVVAEVGDMLEDLDFVAPDVFEPDDTMKTASATKLGTPQERTLHLGPTGVDEDYVRFEAVDQGTYTIETTVPDGTGTDAILQVLDSEGTLLDEIDGGGARNGDRETFTAPAGGFYYVRVTAYTRQTYGPYTLLLDGPSSQ